MTKEITKAIILQEIQDKLKLREFTPSKFLFDETVVPIYDVSDHLGVWAVESKTLNITSAASFVFFVVPATERWVLRSYQVVYGMTGAHKGTGLYVSDRPSASIYIDLKKGQDVSYLINLAVPIVLQPNNRLQYLIDDYTSDQTLTINIDVWKEDVR